MKWHVAMWLVLGLLVRLPFGLAQEPEKLKPAPATQDPPQTKRQSDEDRPSEPIVLIVENSNPEQKVSSLAEGVIYTQPGTERPAIVSMQLEALLHSRQVQESAIKATVKRHLKELPDDFRGCWIATRTNTTIVESYDERLPASLVLDSLTNEAAYRLLDLNRPEQLSSRLDREQRQVEQLRADWTRQRKALIQMAKQYGVEVDPQVAAQRRLHLATETQSLQVQQRGLEARHAVLEKQLADLAMKANDENAAKVIHELSQVVDARKRNLGLFFEARAKGTGSVAEVELEQAKAELALAEAELAKFRREAAAGNNQRASELRNRLDDTLIEKAENEVKLAELERLNTSSVPVDTQRIQVELDEQRYRRASQELDELNAEQLRYTGPKVFLIRTK